MITDFKAMSSKARWWVAGLTGLAVLNLFYWVYATVATPYWYDSGTLTTHVNAAQMNAMCNNPYVGGLVNFQANTCSNAAGLESGKAWSVVFMLLFLAAAGVVFWNGRKNAHQAAAAAPAPVTVPMPTHKND